MKSVLNEVNRLAEKKTGTNPRKVDVGDVINYMSENMTGTDPKEPTVAGALKYYVDNYVSGGGTDTSDATAVAGDIRTGKTAYAKGLKLTGTYEDMFARIGYTSDPLYLDGYDYAKQIYNNWDATITDVSNLYEGNNNLVIFPEVDTSNVTNMERAFSSCSNLKTFPLIDTSNVTNMERMFAECAELVELPLLDTSNVTSMYQMFENCPKLSDNALNNILLMCANAVNYVGDKIIDGDGAIALTPEQKERAKTLSNYQTFLDAGWII